MAGDAERGAIAVQRAWSETVRYTHTCDVCQHEGDVVSLTSRFAISQTVRVCALCVWQAHLLLQRSGDSQPTEEADGSALPG